MRSAEEQCDYGITPDGPKGPRRQVKPGILYLASLTGLAILPASVAFERSHRIAFWDRMPRPFSFTHGVIVVGRPLFVPGPDALAKGEIESIRAVLETTMEPGSAEAREELETLHENGVRDLRPIDPARTH